jgi:rod shape determining protein RodA
VVLAGLLVFVRIDWLKRAAVPLYVLALILLCVVLFFAGDVVKGAGRWIDLGVFKLQPSEFAKIAYLLTISYWLSRHPVSLHKVKTFVVPFFLFIVPFALVLKQPDLSTALVFIAVTMVGFFFAGLTLTDVFLLVSPVLSVLFSHSQEMFFEILWGLLICAVVFALIRRRLPKILSGIFLTLEKELSAGDRLQTGDQVQKDRLSAAGLADDAEDLAFVQGDVDVLQNFMSLFSPAVGLRYISDFQ